VADLAPAVEVALEAFGPTRLIFGSDWPVCLMASTYAEVAATARALTDSLTAAERDAVFGGASLRAYLLAVSAQGIR
jgi:L-fuconolactonase